MSSNRSSWPVHGNPVQKVRHSGFEMNATFITTEEQELLSIIDGSEL